MNFPALPDRWYKLYTYAGIILITYALVSLYTKKVKWDDERMKYNAEVKVLENENQILEEYAKVKISFIKVYSQMHHIENSVSIFDTLNGFRLIVDPNIVLSKGDTFLINNVNTLYNKFFETKEKQAQIIRQKYLLNETDKTWTFVTQYMICISVLGFILLFLGLRVWVIRDNN